MPLMFHSAPNQHIKKILKDNVFDDFEKLMAAENSVLLPQE